MTVFAFQAALFIGIAGELIRSALFEHEWQMLLVLPFAVAGFFYATRCHWKYRP